MPYSCDDDVIDRESEQSLVGVRQSTLQPDSPVVDVKITRLRW